MATRTKTVHVAFAEERFGAERGSDIIGYGSVDLSEDEARDVLATVKRRHRLDDAGISAAALFASPVHRAAIEEILQRLDGHYLAGTVAENRDPSARSNVMLLHLQEHQKAWGSAHRLIEVTCEDNETTRSCNGDFDATGHPYYLAAYRTTRNVWAFYRLAGPVRLRAMDDSAPLKLAGIVASVAALVAVSRETGGFDTLEVAFERSLERHHMGIIPLYPLQCEVWDDWFTGPYAATQSRLAGWDWDCKTDDHANDELRIAACIGIASLRDHRDRLLMMMLGAGMDAEKALALRICEVDIDDYEILYDISRPGRRVVLHEFAFCDDFWMLVQAAESPDAFLFAPINDDFPYGCRRLGHDDIGNIMASRKKQYGIGNDMMPPMLEQGDAVIAMQ